MPSHNGGESIVFRLVTPQEHIVQRLEQKGSVLVEGKVLQVTFEQ